MKCMLEKWKAAFLTLQSWTQFSWYLTQERWLTATCNKCFFYRPTWSDLVCKGRAHLFWRKSVKFRESVISAGSTVSWPPVAMHCRKRFIRLQTACCNTSINGQRLFLKLLSKTQAISGVDMSGELTKTHLFLHRQEHFQYLHAVSPNFFCEDWLVPHFSDHKAHLKSSNFLKNRKCAS